MAQIYGEEADIVKELGITVLAVEHRVKEEKSLLQKLLGGARDAGTTTENTVRPGHRFPAEG